MNQIATETRGKTRGKFITFEGIDGAGKSTHIAGVVALIQAQGLSVLSTREPGGTPLAEQIRSLLLSVNHDEKMSNNTELLLMYAARAQHLQQVILPALAQGKMVLCDRFTDSSFAYQCAGRGLSRDKLELLNQNFVVKMPDITFWLDAPIETGMLRARERGALDRFEQEKVAFFEKVRSGFQELYQAQPERMKRIDATQTPEQVFDLALSYLSVK